MPTTFFIMLYWVRIYAIGRFGEFILARLRPASSRATAFLLGLFIYYERHDRSSKEALSEVSEMKKTKRKVPRLSRNATDEELVRWTKSHDVFERLEAGVSEIIEDHSDLDQVLRDAIFQDNTAQLNMRLPPAMKAVLSKLARQRTTDATTLARIWLAERLERELKAS